ncbi:hypothetical protein IAI10_22610 [Clostridium sp. 19966]|uniref:hypothetical protein n=1 Tax=Clostridium sp. 19966 TaxID=2768166 RepID=UPI0028DF659E|nr:hypothetical protein [Clostridium sp. 19966]MDT8719447.1 hypothetical protein [Clostridium sp. 19966]
MAHCPFLKESAWYGNRCLAIGDKEGVPVEDRYSDYCGIHFLSKEYKDCPLYKNATMKKDNSSSSGCYLTSACMSTKGIEFTDDCLELTTLRNFRDSYVKENYPEDIDTYYKIAPLIVKKIKTLENQKQIFNKMYNDLVLCCCKLIEQNKLNEAYNKYKNYSLDLYKEYL